MITTNATFDARIVEQGIDPVVLVEIGGNVNWVFSSRQLVSGQGSSGGYSYSDYSPIIIDVSDIEYNLAEGLAGVANISDCMVIINNVNPIKSNKAVKMLSSSGIAFHDNSPSADTITDTGNDFLIEGFEAGDKITIARTTNNNKTVTIDSVVAGTATLIASDTLTNESAGTTFSISWNIENQAVVIKQGFMKTAAGTDFTLANFVTAFEGIVKNFQWTEQEMSISVKDASPKRHKLIPQTPIQSDNAHPKANGRLVPITYGDWDYAMGLLVDKTLGAQKYQFDTNALTSMSYLTCYDKDYDYFVPVSALREDQSAGHEYVFTAASGWAIFNDATNPFAEAGLILLRDIFLLDAVLETNGTVANLSNIFDGNIATFGRISVLSTGTPPPDAIPRAFSVGPHGYADARFRILQTFSVGEPLHINFVGKVDMPAGWSDDPSKYMQVQINPNTFDSMVGGGYLSGGADDFSSEIYPFDGDFDNYASPDLTAEMIEMVYETRNDEDESHVRWKRTGWGTINNGRMVFQGFYSGPSSNDFVVDIYEAKLLALSTLRFKQVPFLYCELEGRPFGAGWTGKTAGNMVETPADTINAIYRHELGLADADIDEASFTAVNTRIYYAGYYNFAGQVLEEINSRELIDKLCKQCTARQFKRYDGTESLKVFTAADTSDADFDDDTILKKSFKCERAPFDEVYNEYFVSYNRNQETGEYEGLAYVKADDNNLAAYGTANEADCLESQSKYGFVNRFVIEADFIRTALSAAYLINEICDVQKGYLRHYKSAFEVFLKDGFPIELCDTITIDNDWLPDVVNGSSKKWEVIGLIKKLMEIKIEVKAQSHDGD